MDDLKFSGKIDDKIGKLIQPVFTISWDISMIYDLKKCWVVILNKGNLLSLIEFMYITKK